MKILLVCQCFYPETFRVNDICKELVARGHEVTVLAGHPINRTTGRFWEGYGKGKRCEDTYEGARVVRAYNSERHHDPIHLIFHYFSFWFFGNRKAAKLAKEEKYDAVFVYQLSPVFMAFPGIKVAKKQNIPMVIYTLDLWPDSAVNAGGMNFGPVVKWLQGRVNKIYNAASKILVSSSEFKNKIVAMGHDENKIELYRQYCEDSYKKLERNPEDPIEKELPDGFRIIFTGNIGTSQGIEHVVDAAAVIKEKGGFDDIKWIIVGDGRNMEAVQQRAKEKDVTDLVIFTGRKPMEDMSRYLAASDVALMILREDPLFDITLPAKIQSYMACGMPILGCVKGETASVIKEANCGVVSNAISGNALAEAALSMYNMSKDELAKMGENANAYSKAHFDRKKLMDRLEEVLGEVQ